MKSLLYILVTTAVVMMQSGCSKYTDIEPKGQNLLKRVNDLDLLMNATYAGSAFDFRKQTILTNDNYLLAANVPNAIASSVLTMNKILLTYDETADRPSLTPTDGPYQGLYGIISTVANAVLANADKASGDPLLKQQLKAEAYVIRAYAHYLLVNIYAKAYDPATAATDGGVPYVTDLEFLKLNKKNSVQEVYDNILKDIDAAFELDALPDKPKNYMRAGKGFAYGVKARALQSMRKYEEALLAAEEGLKINSAMEDRRSLLAVPLAQRVPVRSGLNAPDNLFYAYQNNIDPSLNTPSYEILSDYFEPGDIFLDSTTAYNMQFGFLYVGLPNIPALLAIAYEGNSGGMTTSDLYMIKAECLIRTGKVDEGMDIINELRIRRIAPFSPLTASTEADAMAHLQKVARIEFLYTYRNFFDIKRWNREGKYPVVITRTLGDKTYTLQPNSPLWVFPFPQNATQFNETLTQNY